MTMDIVSKGESFIKKHIIGFCTVMAVLLCTLGLLSSASSLKNARVESYYIENTYTFSVSFSDKSNFDGETSIFAAGYSDDGRCVVIKRCDAVEGEKTASFFIDCTDTDIAVFGLYLLNKTSLSPLTEKITLNKSDITEYSEVKIKAFEQSYPLCYNSSMNAAKEGLNSGWVYDGRGGPVKTSLTASYASLMDISAEYTTALIREFNLVDSGVITLETTVKFLNEANGINIDFTDKDKDLTYRLKVKNGYFYLANPEGADKQLCFADLSTTYVLRITVDLDNGTAQTFIDKVNYGESPLFSDNILAFSFNTGESEKPIVQPGAVKIYANYPVNDDFAFEKNGSVPLNYTATGSSYVSSGELVFSGFSGEKRSFTPANGNVVYEQLFILPGGNNAEFLMNSGDDEGVLFSAENGHFVVDGNSVYDFTPNMWYRLRIEANTDTKRVVYKINGRQIAEGTMEDSIKYFDSISINLSSGSLRIDDVVVSVSREYDDYVPQPVTPEGYDDYYVGLNVCNLWVNGRHYGWSCTTPYEELEPVLGYYDENNPETADWEIKFMVEHGINFQAVCWYCDQTNAPLKTPSNMQQLHNGYMNAKYSDMMKYCILWEAANAAHVQSAAFRNYVIPYWVENYFLDDRYMTIDNKLIMCVFGGDRLSNADYFGSDAGVKTEFDYLRSVVKGLGFDDIIILNCSSANQSLVNKGFDGCYAYNWGSSGYSLDVNKNNILNSASFKGLHTVPTISTGFNNIAWAYTRHPNMTVSDYRTAHQWVRDTYLPTYGKGDGGWTDKLVMCSTWNEYGEGTYIMPAEKLNGFGYVDVLREVYTKAGTHTDVVPTSSQKERINHLYPRYAHLLRKLDNYEKPVADKVLSSLAANNTTATYFYPGNSSAISSTSEYISSTALNRDPAIYIKNGCVNVDASKSKTVKITALIPKGEMFELFFLTDSMSTYSQDCSATAYSTSDNWQEFYFDFSGNSSWKGNITSLRMDPCASSGVTYYIKQIEFMDTQFYDINKLYIDDVLIDSVILPEMHDGVMYHPFDPSCVPQNYLRSFMNWDYASQQLTIDANHHTVVYTVGSSTARVDGKDASLGYPVYLVDGLPIISFEKLAEFLGYTSSNNDDGNLYVYTSFYTPTESTDEVSWEFNTDGDSQGWTSSNMNTAATDGCLEMESANTDPTLMSKENLGLSASDFKQIKIRVKYDYTSTLTQRVGFYFITNDDKTWSQSKFIGTLLSPKTSDGEYITYTIDLTANSLWAGTIYQLRFDPFNSTGTMSLDYIRMVDKAFRIVNGDAEDTADVAFFSGSNVGISIVEDSIREGNHVYNIKAPSSPNSYTYMRQYVTWTPGATYTIDYDIRLLSMYDGSAVSKTDIICNIIYNDPISGTKDHIVGNKTIMPTDGWVHVSTSVTINYYSEIRTNDVFSIYSNPSNGYGTNYQVDNIVVKRRS